MFSLFILFPSEFMLKYPTIGLKELFTLRCIKTINVWDHITPRLKEPLVYLSFERFSERLYKEFSLLQSNNSFAYDITFIANLTRP